MATRTITQNHKFSQNAPLPDRFIQQIDKEVTEIATRQIIGPKILPVMKIQSEGVTVLDYWALAAMKNAVIDVDGQTANDDSVDFTPSSVRIPVIHKDFKLMWRDLLAANSPGDGGLNKPLDMANIQEATRQVILGVDDLIFGGNAGLGIDGLTTVTGRNLVTGASWATAGNAFNNVVDTRGALATENFYGPYVGVFHPTQYAEALRVFASTGIPQKTAIEELLDGGFHQTPAITDGTGLVFSKGPMNADMPTATGGPKQMNQPSFKWVDFMIYDLTSVRIRRPKSIATLSGI